ncbi:eCIS core domain-containing protein [Roseitranquillus sediminis]|uniref:eCIS core domain-containing protein n=1 Tax=Roseitranquillus sediminis TaxID=2809051 RepID=UPI001D0C780E|nr:DUF4157 domain-containing protein [Roseitranquillus sediminis]MBM9594972.1 DUF4157 domain-containing protein [Roseitranquillus sediminis]
MQRAAATPEASDALHAARPSGATAAWADPTPRPAPAPAASQRRAPCPCGGGCPRCGEQPVPAPLRRRAETALGHGLSDVRLTTTGPLAARVAHRGADAGTRGNVIAFPRGLPDLSRPEGRFALGHELAHVAQQKGGDHTQSHRAAQERGADHLARAISGAGPARRAADLPAESAEGQQVQFGVFDEIGGAMRRANDLVAPVLDPVMQTAHQAAAQVMMDLLDVPALAMTYVTSLPGRALRLLADVVQVPGGIGDWLAGLGALFVNWQGYGALWNHMVEGILDGAAHVGQFFMHALEIFGAGEFLRFLWARVNWMRPLNAAQIGAAQQVHPPGLIPYSRIRVDYNSLVARLAALFSPGFSGSALDQIFGTSGAQHRAVTTMHIIHTGHTMDESLAVHELTHVAQYELVGAMYMPQAIHAQQFGQGYDYKALDGSLSASIAAGRTYVDFNREQQAMICEDYYRVRNGLGAHKGGAAPDLEHFIDDYWGRAGIPFVRLFVEQ